MRGRLVETPFLNRRQAKRSMSFEGLAVEGAEAQPAGGEGRRLDRLADDRVDVGAVKVR